MSVFIIAVLALAVAMLAYALRRMFYERNALAAQVGELHRNQSEAEAAIREVYNVLDSFTGGIHKRIDEIREITEAIQGHRPELFQEVYGTLHWLEASDQFLCRLRDAVMPAGLDPRQDELRARFARTGRTDAIYEAVRKGIYSGQHRPSLQGG